MDFCSSCGILLSLELVGKSTKCRPCNVEQKTNHNTLCECDYCKTSFSTTHYSRSISSDKNKSEVTPKPTKTKKSRKIKEVRDNTSTSEFQRNQKGQNQTQQNQSLSEDWTSTSAVSQWWAEDFDMQDAWGIQSGQGNQGWSGEQFLDGIRINMDPSSSSTTTTTTRPDGDDDFYVDTHDTTGDLNVVNQRAKAIFGGHDFPVLERGLEEDDVTAGVKANWERQQAEYKRQLEINDNQQIARLVCGHRRKLKDKRYYVGGVDISFIKDNESDACACLSVVRLPDLELVYQAMEMITLTQPYIPGFLAFREVPSLVSLFSDLKRVAPQYTPDVIMVDGNGILHPRGFGLASQLGVILDVPTVGVAKTLMSAQGIVDDDAHKTKKRELNEAGQGFDLVSAETQQVMGKCVRVHDKAQNPVYVSVGHKISLKSAVWLVLECSKYRIPEPIRRADLDSREYIRQGKTEPEVFIL